MSSFNDRQVGYVKSLMNNLGLDPSQNQGVLNDLLENQFGSGAQVSQDTFSKTFNRDDGRSLLSAIGDVGQFQDYSLPEAPRPAPTPRRRPPQISDPFTFPGQPFQDMLAPFRERNQGRLGGIADMIQARDAKGARTPPRFPGGQSPVKNYRQEIIGRMPRPEFGRDTIPLVPPSQGRLPPPSPYERNFTVDSDMGMNNFRNRQRLPRPPGGGTGQYFGPPIGIPGYPERPSERFPQPPSRFPQPFPQPGRKGQRNIPQPGGYYPQPPSSPMYPGQFPSPGRKGNRGSYQQPQMPFGYGQMRDMSSRFGGYGMPQNIYGFQSPHYQPYEPPAFEALPGGPTPQPIMQPGPAPYYPMPEPPGPMPSPGGKGRGGPSPGQLPFMTPDVMPDFGATTTVGGGFMGNPDYYSNAGAQITQPYTEPDFGAAAAAGLRVGTPIGGGGGKMKMGGQTAYPNQNVLSSYMMG